MKNKIIIGAIIAIMLLINSFCYAGNKVIQYDSSGIPQLVDMPQASETALDVESVCAIVFVICLVVAIIIFNYMYKNEKYNDTTLWNALIVVCVIGGIAFLLNGIIYFGSGGWVAH